MAALPTLDILLYTLQVQVIMHFNIKSSQVQFRFCRVLLEVSSLQMGLIF